MVTQQHPEPSDRQPGQAPPETREIVRLEGKEPARPKDLSEAEAQELRERAVALVAELADAGGSRQMELADGITSLGVLAQRRAGTELDLLRERVGETIAGGPGEEISKDLVELRVALHQISPREAGFIRRLLAMLPFVSDPALKTLERIALRYEPASKQVTIIESKLRAGRAMLARDNIELRKLYEQVEEQHLPIQKNAYLGELVMRELNVLLESTDDELKKERVRNVLHDVSMRVQDLRTMEAVYTQFFVSTEMTRQNNTRLGQSVERTLALGTNVVLIGLAIQMALTRQRRVLAATQRTREFLGNLIAANASSILHHTQEIGEVYNNPVIAIDKIAQAQHDLIEAMDIAERLKLEGIQAAKQNIAKLSELTAEMEERSQGLRDDAQPSIEA
jgi:uncharacterized protein YaaN involved in tellurite resistance